jgi:hypothetical protein
MHLSNRKALTIFNALKSMCGYYLQRGFQVVFIKGDGEFAPLEAWMATVYGAPKLNLASANKHIPEIERKIWVIKDGSELSSTPSLDAGSRSFICDETTKSVSHER